MLAYSDNEGNVFDFPGLAPAFRSGKQFVQVEKEDLIKLPKGSYLFSLPGRFPVFFNIKNHDFNHITVDYDGNDVLAVSSFLASGYLRTYLPAYIAAIDAQLLTLWAYAGVVIIDGEFYVPAMRIDEDPRSDFVLHQDNKALKKAVKEISDLYTDNRLVKQLSVCSTEYNCFCARNFFLSRYEAPIPTTPVCNARCIGCLSLQETSSISSCQTRLSFKPTPEEISQVILHHFTKVEKSIASFGQGCEGEPILRGEDLAEAIEIVRNQTDKGTININTNGSMPENVSRMMHAGLDSIRVSLNSPTEEYYMAYHQPHNYTYADVIESIKRAIDGGIFVSINLFFLPGFTDMESEVDALFTFLHKYKVNMIQTRNLNIDPDHYLNSIDCKESKHLGVENMIEMIKNEFPQIKIGYYNPSLK